VHAAVFQICWIGNQIEAFNSVEFGRQMKRIRAEDESSSGGASDNRGGISAASTQAFIGKTMATNATSAWMTAGMAAAAGYNSGPFCGEVNESIVADNMVLGVARDLASSMHGDSGHQNYINATQTLIGPPSTNVILPNGKKFSTLQLSRSRLEHRTENNRLEGELIAEAGGMNGSSSISKKKQRKSDSLLFPTVSNHQHAVPAAIQRSMGGPAAWQMSTPSSHAVKISPQTKSSDGVSSENPIAIDFSNAAPLSSPFEFGSTPINASDDMLARMKMRSMRDSGGVSIHNVETGEFERAPRNSHAMNRYKILNDPDRLISNLDLVRDATAMNPMVNSQEMCHTFDEFYNPC
jgi:hypothetical protein